MRCSQQQHPIYNTSKPSPGGYPANGAAAPGPPPPPQAPPPTNQLLVAPQTTPSLPIYTPTAHDVRRSCSSSFFRGAQGLLWHQPVNYGSSHPATHPVTQHQLPPPPPPPPRARAHLSFSHRCTTHGRAGWMSSCVPTKAAMPPSPRSRRSRGTTGPGTRTFARSAAGCSRPPSCSTCTYLSATTHSFHCTAVFTTHSISGRLLRWSMTTVWRGRAAPWPCAAAVPLATLHPRVALIKGVGGNTVCCFLG